MRNLWAYSWNCRECNWKKYQGPTPPQCEKCGSLNLRRKIMWVGKEKPQSNSYCFDAEPHFNYFNDFTNRPEYKKDLEETGITETMSLQGSCFMCAREMYWDLNLCDENFGNWGNQGIEVAVKTWLSGGRVLVNHKTWYAHLFRTQGGDFGFPWPISGRATAKTKQAVKDHLWKQSVEGRSIKWLVEKFWPVPGWAQVDLDNLS